MSEDTLEPGSLEFKMNKAILSMNRKLKDHGYSERERAAMWEMTVAEHREFLTMVWEHVNNDKKAEQDAQIDKLHGAGAAAVLEEAIADGSVFSDSSRDEEYPENWVACACGSMKVAPGTRTELAGVSHGETPCFVCDDKGQPIDKEAERTAQLTATAAVKEIVDQNPDLDPDELRKIKVEQLDKARIESINLVAEEPNPEAGVHPIEVKPTPPKPGPPGKAAQTNN